MEKQIKKIIELIKENDKNYDMDNDTLQGFLEYPNLCLDWMDYTIDLHKEYMEELENDDKLFNRIINNCIELKGIIGREL